MSPKYQMKYDMINMMSNEKCYILFHSLENNLRSHIFSSNMTPNIYPACLRMSFLFQIDPLVLTPLETGYWFWILVDSPRKSALLISIPPTLSTHFAPAHYAEGGEYKDFLNQSPV